MRRDKPAENFKLETFFPYLVRIYYRAVSRSVSTIYEKEYDLTVSEWRAMAVLGNSDDPLSAGEIVTRSSIDKVKVSRAISGLTQKGYLERKVDEGDRRKVALQLTRNGYYVFDELVAKVQDLESQLLEGFDAGEKDQLLSLMARVRKNADKLNGSEEM
ncbi:Transcriptional regulator, MarR family [Candidatus Terasakiella magnetica]|uniref:Transcriptional regulator, MarR family n=1 Tax=Candidatus Terasakiella magnetica TaxID=1867952 RepID=A0A1C3RC33_9PROT|nr:MarR family transcriptional regulator [Candidatus Terasakiella magnetica]SCA54839.1 Transcriptional regulator, MarR family [Candidatus Terasakiella magnetica]